MKKLLIASTIAFVLSAASYNQAYANNNTNKDDTSDAAQNHLIGFGSGATAGALIAGPAGAVVGGIFGLFIAEDVNSDAALAQSNEKLSRAQHSLQQQDQRYSSLKQDYQSLQEEKMLQLVSFEQQSDDQWLKDFTHFETNLQFKTASFLIEKTYTAQLDSLAALLVTYPQLSVNVTGFADQRGDSQYNQSLSMQRAEAVKEYLIDKAVKVSQIMVIGAGETTITPTLLTNISETGEAISMPASLNVEDLFFERRVNINLFNADTTITAAN